MQYIMGQDGCPNTPYKEVLSLDEITEADLVIMQADWSATSTNPALIYKSAAGQLETYSLGGYHDIAVTRYNGSTGLLFASEGLNHLCVVAYSNVGLTPTQHRVMWGVTNGTGSDFLAQLQNGQLTSDNILFSQDGGVFPLAVYEREWDEGPSTDPNDLENLLPRGGENADTGDYDDTDLMLEGYLPDPSDFDFSISKLCTLYQLDYTQIATLGEALFDNNFWNNLKNKFEGLSDPISMMLDCYQMPCAPGTTATSTFKLGGIQLESGGNPISCKSVTSRYKKGDCGSIQLKEVWGTALDYTDTSIQIFLPFVGMKELDPDIVVGSTMKLFYRIDMWTGDVVYLLHVKAYQSAKYFHTEAVPYRWNGNCKKKIPVGRVDLYQGQMQMIATVMNTTASLVNAAATGNPAGIINAGANIANLMGTGLRANVSSSGNVAGAPGYMDYMTPYLVVKRSVPEYPANWRAEIGAPRYQEFTISGIHGYTEFAEVHADDVDGASDAEKKLIEQQLMQGVILP